MMLSNCTASATANGPAVRLFVGRVILAAHLLLLCPLEARADWTLPPGREAAVQALAAPWVLDAQVAPTVLWDGLKISNDTLLFLLKSEVNDGVARVRLSWHPESRPLPPAEVQIELMPAADPGLAAAAEVLRARLAGVSPERLSRELLVWSAPPSQPAAPPPLRVFRPFDWQECVNALAVPPVWLWGASACLALGALWLLRRRAPLSVQNVALVAGAGLPLWAWQYMAPVRESVPDRGFHDLARREWVALTALLLLAASGWLAAAWRGVRVLRRPHHAVRHVHAALVALGVAGISVAIRYGLARLNLMTDADSGYERLLTYVGGFGGDHLILTHLLPARFHASLDAYMQGIRALASLGPPLLVLAAVGHGLSVTSAGLAGLFLATWPVHAALSASDVLQGPVLTLVAMAVLQLGAARPFGVLGGFLTLSLALWSRPELALTLAPIVLLAWPAVGDPRRRPAAVAGLAVLGTVIGVRWLSLLGHGLLVPRPPGSDWWQMRPPEGVLPDPAILPWTVAAGLVLVLLVERRHALLRAIAFLGICVPWLIAGTRSQTLTQLEALRYAAPSALWLALLGGLGWAALATRLPAARRSVLLAAIVAGSLALPWALRGYLGRTYDSTAEAPLFVQALGQLPENARLVLPGEARDDGLNPCNRYRLLAEAAKSAGRTTNLTTVCADEVLAERRRTGGAGPDATVPTFWFHGTDCQVGSAVTFQADLGSCAALEAEFPRTLVWQAPIDLWHRRAVSTSTDPGPPAHQSRAFVRLERLGSATARN